MPGRERFSDIVGYVDRHACRSRAARPHVGYRDVVKEVTGRTALKGAMQVRGRVQQAPEAHGLRLEHGTGCRALVHGGANVRLSEPSPSAGADDGVEVAGEIEASFHGRTGHPGFHHPAHTPLDSRLNARAVSSVPSAPDHVSVIMCLGLASGGASTARAGSTYLPRGALPVNHPPGGTLHLAGSTFDGVCGMRDRVARPGNGKLHSAVGDELVADTPLNSTRPQLRLARNARHGRLKLGSSPRPHCAACVAMSKASPQRTNLWRERTKPLTGSELLKGYAASRNGRGNHQRAQRG
jgi:hypothetical protein